MYQPIPPHVHVARGFRAVACSRASWGASLGMPGVVIVKEPVMSTREVLHQMRPWPPVWTRPMNDRPPYKVWALGGLLVWAIVLTVFDASSQTQAICTTASGWCSAAGASALLARLSRTLCTGGNDAARR